MKSGQTAKFLLLLLFLVGGKSAFSQNVVIGEVVSAKDKTPVVKASVYINTTSKVTLSGSDGSFAFAGVLYPFELVVSCVGYERQIVNVTKDEGKIRVELNEYLTKLDTVDVTGSEAEVGAIDKKKKKTRLKNMRAANFQEFKTCFLGDDRWGSAAVLKDNASLRFWHQVDTVFRAPEQSDFLLLKYHRKLGDGYAWTKDSSMVYQYSTNLYATSVAPIMMELPMLGYDVSLDLEQFHAGEMNEKRKIGYSYYSCFIPRKDTLTVAKAEVEQNRREVYYNSVPHFFRALLNHQLYENGYLVALDKNGYDWTMPENRKYISIDSLVVKLSENTYAITGLKGKTLRITYFSGKHNAPLNLNAKINKKGERRIPWSSYNRELSSSFIFHSDTCLVRKDGITSDNRIVIDGKMAEKLAGAILPIDYEPAVLNENMH